MKIIKNSKELAKLVDENKDLFLKEEDIRIEFEPSKDELRDVYCRNLFLENDIDKFNFNGWNFNGRDFNGRDFNGWNFNGLDFNGLDFNGGDFNGGDFNGRDISYFAFFICYKGIKCNSWKKRRENALDPICIDGKLEIKETKDSTV